jgi:hypothetical protein
MKVSITEDATMSLTRSDGGATVVRVDAIYGCVGNAFLPLKLHRAYFLLRPWLSLVLAEAPVNKETETLVNVMEIEAVSCDFHYVVRLRVRSMSEV